MTHFEWIRNSFTVLAQDEASKSILFEAYGNIECEINGVPFSINNRKDFWEAVEMFRGETFEE